MMIVPDRGASYPRERVAREHAPDPHHRAKHSPRSQEAGKVRGRLHRLAGDELHPRPLHARRLRGRRRHAAHSRECRQGARRARYHLRHPPRALRALRCRPGSGGAGDARGTPGLRDTARPGPRRRARSSRCSANAWPSRPATCCTYKAPGSKLIAGYDMRERSRPSPPRCRAPPGGDQAQHLQLTVRQAMRRAALAALASASVRATSGIARSRSPRRCLGRPSPHDDHDHHRHHDGQGDQGQMAAPPASIWSTLLLMKIRQLLKLGGAGV